MRDTVFGDTVFGGIRYSGEYGIRGASIGWFHSILIIKKGKRIMNSEMYSEMYSKMYSEMAVKSTNLEKNHQNIFQGTVQIA